MGGAGIGVVCLPIQSSTNNSLLPPINRIQCGGLSYSFYSCILHLVEAVFYVGLSCVSQPNIAVFDRESEQIGRLLRKMRQPTIHNIHIPATSRRKKTKQAHETFASFPRALGTPKRTPMLQSTVVCRVSISNQLLLQSSA